MHAKNITSIELKTSEEESDINQVFRLITKYCNNLREIDFEENILSDENIKEFQRKFGPKINFIHRLKDANNYNLFPNIERLKFDENHKNLRQVIPRLKLNKLKQLVIEIGEEEEEGVMADFTIFVNEFNNQIGI